MWNPVKIAQQISSQLRISLTYFDEHILHKIMGKLQTYFVIFISSLYFLLLFLIVYLIVLASHYIKLHHDTIIVHLLSFSFSYKRVCNIVQKLRWIGINFVYFLGDISKKIMLFQRCCYARYWLKARNFL